MSNMLTSGSPMCFYNCPRGYVNLKFDSNTTFNEVSKYYYEFIKQDTIYVEVNGSILPLRNKPVFGYFIVSNDKETNLFVPFTNVRYKDIHFLIKNGYMINLYYPVCSYYNNTRIELTFRKEKEFFKSKYIIMSYDKLTTHFDISTLYATLAKKVEITTLYTTLAKKVEKQYYE